MLSTYYPGHGESFERIMGEGYFRKTVKGKNMQSIRRFLLLLVMILF